MFKAFDDILCIQLYKIIVVLLSSKNPRFQEITGFFEKIILLNNFLEKY